jgi:hypothetical protein
MLFQKSTAAFGEVTVAGDLAARNGLSNIKQLFAGDVRAVKRDAVRQKTPSPKAGFDYLLHRVWGRRGPGWRRIISLPDFVVQDELPRIKAPARQC